MICAHAKICSVCNWIEIPYAEQKGRKLSLLQDQLSKIQIPPLSDIQYLEVADQAIRDRVDLVFENGRLGFYQQNQREAFQVESCPLMSRALHDFYQDFRKISFPIRKGSLRLRASPRGARGIWLDFANEDIRDLLAEKTTLSALMDLGFVEIGQRRKSLTRDFKLKDPQFHSWTRTWIANDQAVELQSVVGGFSQSGDQANRVLISQMQKYFRSCTSRQWVEFGSGNGNLTLALAGTHSDFKVKALEFDAVSLEGLKKTLQAYPELAARIELRLGDFQRKEVYQFSPEEAVLVNPPRSGLMKFLDPLFEIPKSQRPRDFVYMSCHIDSFTTDSARLKELGYELQEISIVDQFPHSPHFEILSRWTCS